MIKYEHLLNRPYIFGSQDCYGLARDFYKDNFGIELTDYARPENWEDSDLDLFTLNYHDEGFRAVDVHPRDYWIGDAFLISINSTKANLVAIYIGENEVLYHPSNLLSRKGFYGGTLRNRTTMVLRHKDVPDLSKEQHTVDILQYLPKLQQKVRDAGGTVGSEVGGDGT